MPLINFDQEVFAGIRIEGRSCLHRSRVIRHRKNDVTEPALRLVRVDKKLERTCAPLPVQLQRHKRLACGFKDLQEPLGHQPR